MSDSSGQEINDLGNVRMQQVEALLELLAASAIRQKDHLRRRYCERAPHFDETLRFVSLLGCVRDGGDTLSLDGNPDEVAVGGNALQQEMIRRLSSPSSPFRKALSRYLAQFEVMEGRVAYRPLAQRSSGEGELRNLLMDLHIVAHNESAGEYVLNTDFISLYLQVARDTAAVAPEVISARHVATVELGSAAELAVLSHELRRLGEPHSRYVKHIAETDAAAGYDIESVTVLSAAITEPRLIEVKAVPASNLRFFWTSNEVAAARRFAAWYYLYLLPLRGEGEFDIDRLVIIENPYEVVIKGDSGWCVDADILRCEIADHSSRQFEKLGATA